MIVIIKTSQRNSFQHGVRTGFLLATTMTPPYLREFFSSNHCKQMKESWQIYSFSSALLTQPWGPGSAGRWLLTQRVEPLQGLRRCKGRFHKHLQMLGVGWGVDTGLGAALCSALLCHFRPVTSWVLTPHHTTHCFPRPTTRKEQNPQQVQATVQRTEPKPTDQTLDQSYLLFPILTAFPQIS